MNKYQTALFAGVAVLALTAGIDGASAQNKDHGAGGPPAAATQAGPSAEQGGGVKDEGGPHGKAQEPTTKNGPSAAAKPTPGAKSTATTKTAPGGKPTAAAKSGKEPGGQTAQGANTKTNPKGAAANTEHQPGPAGTAGGNVKLSEQQRTQIRTTIINGSNAPRVTHVNFDIKIGVAVPRESVHVVPVPETLVVIEPQWRGFLYFVYEDEVVIVSPDDMRIVAVIEV